MTLDRHRRACVVVTTTVASAADAAALARALVGARLAACAQVLPIRSVYRWKGCVESQPEYLLLLKTTTRRANALMGAIRERHTYELPEMAVIPLNGGLPAYLDWIRAETRPERDCRRGDTAEKPCAHARRHEATDASSPTASASPRLRGRIPRRRAEAPA